MRWCLSLITSLLLLTINAQTSEEKLLKVVIDAGHGGKDPGNLNSKPEFLKEKDINLNVALVLGGYIETYLGHKVDVIYTRKTDTFVELNDRILIANNAQADFFISVHCNASPRTTSIGTETHIHNLENKTSLDLAHAIEKQFSTRAGRISRGVKVKNDRLYNLMVLQYTKMPSVLVEMGFMTNEREEHYLNTQRGQDITASAIFRAFRDYVTEKYDFEQREKQPEQIVQTNEADSTKNPQPKIEIPEGPIYRIQVFASTGPISPTSEYFKPLNQTVTEFKIEANNIVWHKYYVGIFEKKREAKKALKDIQKVDAFKDAFVVRFE